MADKRVKFDFEIYFTNGGSIKGEDFRLDIEGDGISDQMLADYIVEDLQQLPEEGFTFSAVPPKFKGMGTFPVRAMARVPKIR